MPARATGNPTGRRPVPEGGTAPARSHNGAITVYKVERQLASGNETYWRATRLITVGAKKHRVSAQKRYKQEAVEELERKVVKLRVAYAELPVEALEPAAEFEVITVARVLEDWLQRKRKDLKPASYRMYDSRIRLHILPAFGDKPVRLLTRKDIEKLLHEQLPDRGLGVSTIRQVHITLKSALDEAIEEEYITAHPMRRISPPKENRRTEIDRKRIRRAGYILRAALVPTARSLDESSTFSGSHHQARWLLGLLGLRQAEVLGLTDDDLEARKHRLHVRQQLTRVAPEHGCGPWNSKTRSYPCGRKNRGCATPKTVGRWELTTTKSAAGERALDLPPNAWAVLIEQRNRQRAMRNSNVFYPEPGDNLNKLLFSKPDGKPIYGQADREALYAILEHIKRLPEGVTPHMLRHIATTTLIAEKVDKGNLIAIMGWNPKNAESIISNYNQADMAKLSAADVALLVEQVMPTTAVAQASAALPADLMEAIDDDGFGPQ